MIVGSARSAQGAAPASRRARRWQGTPPRAGDLKEAALLEVAKALVQEGKFYATPIAQIAARAGVSRQGFYFYYQSKDELLAQLVTEVVDAHQPWPDTFAVDDWHTPSTVMRRLAKDTVEMWRTNRELFVAVMEVAPRSAVVFAQWRAAVEETAKLLVELIVSETTVDALRDDDAARRAMVSLIWMIERNCHVHVVYGSDETDEALADRMANVWLRSLGLTSA